MLLAFLCWPTLNQVLVGFLLVFLVGFFLGWLGFFFVRGGDFLVGLFW